MMRRALAVLLTVLCFMLCMSAAAELPAELTDIGESAFEGDVLLTGVLNLPEGVKTVGRRAFASTGLHGLIVPDGCVSLAADVLSGSGAAYVTLSGAETVVDANAMAGVSFVFGPEGGSAAGMTGFYASETLFVQDDFYYSITENEALVLCPILPMEDEIIILPKLVDGMPLRQLDTLALRGCRNVTISVPSYLDIPEGVDVIPYDAMTLTAPVASVTECTEGDAVTWTTEITGDYGDVSYIWLFNVDGRTSSMITATPKVTWTAAASGSCIVSVTATDALGDTARAHSETITIHSGTPVYRALLIGNTYAGTSSELDGTDTDARAMATMLRSMTGTPYSISTQYELTASGIQSAITSTFAGARPRDVSLFFFSGHGTNAGSLVGIGNTYVSVSSLRAWLDTIPGTKIVIIDCCYSGMLIGKSDQSGSPSSFTSAFISGFSRYTKDSNLASNGYIVMTACSKTQVSQSLSVSDGTIAFGAFTYGLCYGCGYDEWHQTSLGSMSADTNRDGQITLSEAYSATVERVSWLSSLTSGIEQSAQYYGDGDYVLWGR